MTSIRSQFGAPSFRPVQRYNIGGVRTSAAEQTSSAARAEQSGIGDRFEAFAGGLFGNEAVQSGSPVQEPGSLFSSGGLGVLDGFAQQAEEFFQSPLDALFGSPQRFEMREALQSKPPETLRAPVADLFKEMPLGETGLGREIAGQIMQTPLGFLGEGTLLDLSPRQVDEQYGGAAQRSVEQWIGDQAGAEVDLFIGGTALAAVGRGALSAEQAPGVLEELDVPRPFQNAFFGGVADAPRAAAQTPEFTWDFGIFGSPDPPQGAEQIPITNDRYTDADFEAVPGKVAEVVSHEPGKLSEVWDEVAADGRISKADADRLDRVMGDVRIFGHEIHDGTDTTEAKFIAMRLASRDVQFDPEVRRRYEAELAARQERMENGEILSGTFERGDTIHELTEGIVDMPYDEFMKKMPADRWGVNLAEYRGGEVKVTERDAQGRVIKQRERMVLETPLSKLLPGVFEANDMTKVESIEYGPDMTVVRWEVLDSDNKTTLKDIGEVRFIRMGDKTKIEFESEHRIDPFPGMLEKLEDLGPLDRPYKKGIAMSMQDYFKSCIAHYQDLAAGKIDVQ
jgi:hypothetical protein